MISPELIRKLTAEYLLTQATHRTEELLGVTFPWAVAHIVDTLSPDKLRDHIFGYGKYLPVDVTYPEKQEGPVLFVQNNEEVREKLSRPETPLIVVSGPSTSGQTAVTMETMKYLRNLGRRVDRIMTATTKSQDRPGEATYYEYLDPEKFTNRADRGELAEFTTSTWGDSYGTPIANIDSVLETQPDFAFLIVDNDGSRNIADWMSRYHPNNPTVRLFMLLNTSPMAIAYHVITKRKNFADWIPRIADALHDIYDAGNRADFDAIVKNLIEPSGIPIRTSCALAQYLDESKTATT